MKTRIGVTLGALALVGAFAAVQVADEDGNAELTVEQAVALAEFDLYWVGEEFDGLPLTHVDRVKRPGPTAPGDGQPLQGMDMVDFGYGDCEARSDQGCGLPLEIQVSPACARNLAMLDIAVSEHRTIRGAHVALFGREASEDPEPIESPDAIGRIEVYTGDVTIVLFGYPGDRLLRAVDSLRRVGDSEPGALLPPPVEGALEATLSCPSHSDS